jgi:hypothetical protein
MRFPFPLDAEVPLYLAPMAGVSMRMPLPKSMGPKADGVMRERQLPMIWAE